MLLRGRSLGARLQPEAAFVAAGITAENFSEDRFVHDEVSALSAKFLDLSPTLHPRALDTHRLRFVACR